LIIPESVKNKVCVFCGKDYRVTKTREIIVQMFCSNRCRADSNPSKRKRTPEYNTWKGVRQRCNNKNDPAYKHYGGRGIKVCKRWDDYELFLKDMGHRPSTRHSIDRIDNDGNYQPDNCRWATLSEQRRNTRQNHVINGKTLIEWSEIYDVPYTLLQSRINESGWSLEKAINTPVMNAFGNPNNGSIYK